MVTGKRDNWNLIYERITTLRFGVQHVRTQEDCCRTGAGITRHLSDKGPPIGHPCSHPRCPVQRLHSGPTDQ